MINDKKGMSAIIVTLIMILLVIVAAGIIWVVIQNVVGESTDQINLGTDCLNVNVEATKVVNVTDNLNYSFTLTRSAGGKAIGGVKLILTNATGTSSDVLDVPGNIEPLATLTTGKLGSTIANANKVEVVSYFKDTSGNEQLCSISSSFDFAI